MAVAVDGPVSRRGDTHGRKTAISVPDDVLEQAERLAQQTGRSRSELYSTALAQYLASHDADSVANTLDRVVTALDQNDDRFPTELARRTLTDVEWQSLRATSAGLTWLVHQVPGRASGDRWSWSRARRSTTALSRPSSASP